MDSYLSTTFDVYSLHGFWERRLNRRHQKQGPNSVYDNLWLYTTSAKNPSKDNKTGGLESQTSSANTSALAGAKFKTAVLAYDTPPTEAQMCHEDFCHWTPFGGPIFRPYRGTSWPGWLGHFAFRWLGVHGQEPWHRVTVWHRIRYYR